MRAIPVGIQDFRRIREEGRYYVDKTPLIDYIESEYATVAFQFIRPRRFGKSTNLSMIDAYFNLRYRGNSWFDGLMISEIRPDDPEKNDYPVIYLDMKEVGCDSYESFVSDIRLIVSGVCKKHQELLESESLDFDSRGLFRELMGRSTSTSVLKRSLRLLSDMFHAHYGRKTIILIDEYDNPLNRSYESSMQRDVLDFLRDFLSSALKGNENLRFGVVTGVMQIAKESIFSGLNNLRVNNILSTDADEMFGFTPKEVERMCADFGHPEKFTEARDWYYGYRFGNADIYNPWSVLRYVDSGFKTAPYWAWTSGNDIIADLLSMSDEETYSNIISLGSGGGVSSDLKPGVTFADIRDLGKGIYSVMALSGYLTAQYDRFYDRYILRIPNREMYGVFADAIVDRIGRNGMSGSMRSFAKAVLSDDTERMEVCLKDLFEHVISGRVLDNEHSYQAFIAGLLMNLFGNYEITADFESGEGYHDIRLRRVRGSGPNVVIEVKRSKVEDPSDDQVTSLAGEALKQIVDNDYAHGMVGRTILYGIAFSGKTPTIVSEVVSRAEPQYSMPFLAPIPLSNGCLIRVISVTRSA